MPNGTVERVVNHGESYLLTAEVRFHSRKLHKL